LRDRRESTGFFSEIGGARRGKGKTLTIQGKLVSKQGSPSKRVKFEDKGRREHASPSGWRGERNHWERLNPGSSGPKGKLVVNRFGTEWSGPKMQLFLEAHPLKAGGTAGAGKSAERCMPKAPGINKTEITSSLSARQKGRVLKDFSQGGLFLSQQKTYEGQKGRFRSLQRTENLQRDHRITSGNLETKKQVPFTLSDSRKGESQTELGFWTALGHGNLRLRQGGTKISPK